MKRYTKKNYNTLMSWKKGELAEAIIQLQNDIDILEHRINIQANYVEDLFKKLKENDVTKEELDTILKQLSGI